MTVFCKAIEQERLLCDFIMPIHRLMADFIAKHDNFRTILEVRLLPVMAMSWVTLRFWPVSTVSLILFLSFGVIALVNLRKKKVMK